MARKRLLRKVHSMRVGEFVSFPMVCPTCGRRMTLRRTGESEWTLICWSHFRRTFLSPEMAADSVRDRAWWGEIRDEVERRRGLLAKQPDGLEF